MEKVTLLLHHLSDLVLVIIAAVALVFVIRYNETDRRKTVAATLVILACMALSGIVTHMGR